MNAFDAKRVIEAQALAVLLPYLEEQSNGRYVLTAKGALARWLQESIGDVIANDREDRIFAIELKAERKHTGNLFLETWSNKNLNVRSNHANLGSNPGWLWKIRADLLLYYFLDADILYSVDVFSLKRWAFGYGRKKDERVGRLVEYRERLVDEEQLNDTWGRCVPVSDLYRELPKGAMKQTSVRQRGLEAA